MIKYAVIILLLLPLVVAIQGETYGYANVQIINTPPILQEAQLTPTTVYEDTTLECLAKVEDEQLNSVKLHYTWTVNGKETRIQGHQLRGFHENDEIQCTVYAEDNIHQLSNRQSVQISVTSAPLTAKALSTALNGVGIEMDIAHSLRLQNQGTAAITGYVIDESGKNGTSALLLVLFGLVFLTVLNANLFLRYYLKKQASKV
ncbi:MAG TPA: hypothetical protein VJG90_00145 [Candidatus Nanoarchaeia archaeon]|nr:hypothetical protein [Candidatus Nanoarchaeia archaeon]